MKTFYYNNGSIKNPEWSKNWGDIIAPTIIKHFSKSDKIEPTENKFEKRKLVSIGSVMSMVYPNDLVWGTGIIMNNCRLPRFDNVKFFAVRGPNTRQQLIELGYDVPAVYGDPGLLYPQIYNPVVEKTHEWGIIPHYVDVDHPSVKSLVKAGVKFIDINAGEKEFIDQLLSVDKVISSSLHGLIAADAYGIPNARITLTDKLVGGDYKFKDYSLSVDRELWKAVKLIGPTSIHKINNLKLNTKINWDHKLLLDNAPWNHEEYKGLFY